MYVVERVSYTIGMHHADQHACQSSTRSTWVSWISRIMMCVLHERFSYTIGTRVRNRMRYMIDMRLADQYRDDASVAREIFLHDRHVSC